MLESGWTKKNLKSFTKVYPYKGTIEKYFVDLRAVANRLKSVVYTPKLRELDQKITAFENKELELSPFAEYIRKTAAANKVDIKDLVNFKKLADTLEYEKKINFDNEVSKKVVNYSKRISGQDSIS